MQFLVGEEADYLCGTTLHARSPERTNYRLGYYLRKLRTPIGRCSVRVPHLLYFFPRVPIVKRARRLSAGILEDLAHVYNVGITPDKTAALIKTLWTLDLSDDLLAALVEKLTPILEHWLSDSRSGCPDRLDKPSPPSSSSQAQAVETPASTATAFSVY